MFKINITKRNVKMDTLPDHIPPVFTRKSIFGDDPEYSIEYQTINGVLVAFVKFYPKDGKIGYGRIYEWSSGYWKFIKIYNIK